jgi:hypothetical protein
MLSRLTLPCALLVLALQPVAYSDVACNDIATVDLANSTLPVPGEPPLAFSNGIACPPDYDGDPGCEWKAEIFLDLLTTPEAGMRVRILDIGELHMRGSGASGGWSRLLAYRCDHGRLLAAFAERFECGADVIKAFGPSLLVSVSEGWPKYTHGCQARSASVLFTWSPAEHTFRLDPISGGSDRPSAPPVVPLPVPGTGNLPP